MQHRDELIAKMAQTYSDKIRLLSPSQAMAEALLLAENYFANLPLPEPPPPQFFRSVPDAKIDAAYSIIIQWLRNEVPPSIRHNFPPDLCYKLAARLAILGGE